MSDTIGPVGVWTLKDIVCPANPEFIGQVSCYGQPITMNGYSKLTVRRCLPPLTKKFFLLSNLSDYIQTQACHYQKLPTTYEYRW
jgi:hypothetical protein